MASNAIEPATFPTKPIAPPIIIPGSPLINAPPLVAPIPIAT
ncbi:hypothetical protein [Streptococcus agalactiae]|nr:hypothetical protein [Streptococcus agalactiae]